MRTHSSSNLVGESSPNLTTSNSKRRNRRRSKQPFILEESPVDTMADQRIMAELLRAPTEGYAEPIVVPLILVKHFELKHSFINMMTSDQFFELEKDNPHDHIHWFNKITSTIKYKDVPNSAIKLILFPFSLAGAARRWLKKETPRSILTWKDLVFKFINEFFPPSRTTNLRNEISNFQQRFDESFHEAWDRYKDLLCAFPHHGFTEFHQLDTLYNALNPADQDSLNSNSAAGGNLFQAKLTHAVNQQASAVTTAMTAILKHFQATPPPASVKSVEEICVTCGGAHPYYQCLAADGNTFLEIWDNIQGYVSAAAVNYNQGPLPSNTIANLKGEQKAITTRSGLILDGPVVPMPPPFINPEEDERVEETLTDQDLAEYTVKKLPEKLGDPGKFLIPCGFSEIKCKSLADLANRAICTPAGIARDVFVSVGKFTFPADFVIVDYETDPRVPLILGRPFLRTTSSLIDVHGEEMILRDGDERLTLNMRHGTSSYSNQPQKESIIMINIYNDSCKDYLEDLFATNHLSSNPTFSSHTDLTLPKVKDDIFDPEGDSEFTNELALITFPLGNDDLSFDIESDLRKIEYLLNHDPTKEMDSILEDSVDEDNLAEPNNDLFDIIPEMFTDEHTLDYSSLPLYDDLVELESNNKYVYDDSFDSKEDKIKESKLLTDELDPPRSSDFLLSSEYNSFLFEDFFQELPRSETLFSFSSKNEEKVFKPRILTFKGVHTSLLPELSHRGPKAFKVIKIFESPMEIFPCSYGEDIRILNVPYLHFYPP
uniref:Reverse transcriptase domain-containing protein n=1 Tax=Tanacetum cinerariifolium TaxID=118510 RepID=A0A699HTJ7_TANCI|nr:reverse transcriptase domain-containing protein [Tanacetum cinerariifolium]